MKTPPRQGTCEVFLNERGVPEGPQCGKPALWRYPAKGGGYMRLCAEHGEKHRTHSAEWLGLRWSCGPWESEEPRP